MTNEIKTVDCDVYKSNTREEVYIYVNSGQGLEKVPEALLKQFKDPEFCFAFKLEADRKLAREDSSKVMMNLKEQGYHLQMPPVIVGQLGKSRLEK